MLELMKIHIDERSKMCGGDFRIFSSSVLTFALFSIFCHYLRLCFIITFFLLSNMSNTPSEKFKRELKDIVYTFTPELIGTHKIPSLYKQQCLGTDVYNLWVGSSEKRALGFLCVILILYYTERPVPPLNTQYSR